MTFDQVLVKLQPLAPGNPQYFRRPNWSEKRALTRVYSALRNQTEIVILTEPGGFVAHVAVAGHDLAADDWEEVSQ